MSHGFCSIFGANIASKIDGKSSQVGPSWAKLGSSWPNWGPSWAKLACHMQALMYKFTRCGSHALLERILAHHNANMARKPSQNGGLGGQEGPRELQEWILIRFWMDFGMVLEEFWGGFGKTFILLSKKIQDDFWNEKMRNLLLEEKSEEWERILDFTNRMMTMVWNGSRVICHLRLRLENRRQMLFSL